VAEIKASEIVSRSPRVGFEEARAAPPSPVYVGVDDRIYMRGASVGGSHTLRISGRVLLPDGIVVPFVETLSTTGATFSISTFRIPEGFLLSLAAALVSAATPSGIVWVEIGILRGRPADYQTAQILISAAPSSSSSVSWPPGIHRLSVDEPGHIVVAANSDAAAGAEFSVSVPATQRWRLDAIRLPFVTDATVANRSPRIEFVTGATILWRSRPFDVQAASTTRTYNWARGVTYAQAPLVNEYQGDLPDVLLPPSTIIRTATDLIQVGDDYGTGGTFRRAWFDA